MTREEISVLSSSRRDNVRKQMEEIERYKSNPMMYILNPRVQVSAAKDKATWRTILALVFLMLFNALNSGGTREIPLD
jgi:hypothetical protein